MKRNEPNISRVNVERLGQLAELMLSKSYRWYEYRIDALPFPNSQVLHGWYSMPALDTVISESINVFPDLWCWHEEDDDIAIYKHDPLMNSTSSAMLFYNLDIIMFTHLFVPQRQSPHYFGGTILEEKIRPLQIGNNIREFIKFYHSILN